MTSAFRTTPNIQMGAGCLAELGPLARKLGGTRCLVVTDPGIEAAGILARVTRSLEAAGLATTAFTGVEPDPRYQIAETCADALREYGADIVVGVGGGSSLDIAKVAAICGSGEKRSVRELFGVDLVPGPGLPCVLIPTTAGTGSEVTPIAILSDEEAQLKKGIVSEYLFPAAAVLDPELTVGLPAAVTAATGLDALIHAVEAFTSVKATSLTDLLAFRAMEIIPHSLRTACTDGGNIEARTRMLEGSLLAGMAFANAGVTAVHAFAYPLGAMFHIPHGVANSVMLVSVLQFNLSSDLPKFARLADAFAVGEASDPPQVKAERAVEAVKQLIVDVGVPTRLRDLGVPESALERMAAGAMQVTRLLANNPRSILEADAVAIYRNAF